MAEAKKTKSKKSIVRKSQTVRERTEQSSTKKTRRFRKPSASKLSRPFKKAKDTGKKEYNMPLPDNKAGKVLGKRVRIFPRFFVEAWREIRLVTWPNRKETIRLTIAVFVFAFVFAVIVGVLDFALDKIFKQLILKS